MICLILYNILKKKKQNNWPFTEGLAPDVPGKSGPAAVCRGSLQVLHWRASAQEGAG